MKTIKRVLANIFKGYHLMQSKWVDLIIEGIVFLFLSKLDLLEILEGACLGSTDGGQDFLIL